MWILEPDWGVQGPAPNQDPGPSYTPWGAISPSGKWGRSIFMKVSECEQVQRWLHQLPNKCCSHHLSPGDPNFLMGSMSETFNKEIRF